MGWLPRAFGVLTTTLVLTLFLGGTTQAGIVWCVKDPIFEIDGRVVQVQDLVPAENLDTPVHFVLRVARDSKATWSLPPGETLIGSVTIVKDRKISRDRPILYVSGEGPTFPMQVHVSGPGLRTGEYLVQGTSRGMTVPLRLVELPDDDDDD